jgi:hypothetical protein
MTDWVSIATTVGALAAVLAFLYVIYREQQRHAAQHTLLQPSLSMLLAWAAEDKPQRRIAADALVRSFERNIQGNPVTPAQIDRRQQLTQRMNAGQQLSTQELQDLLGILNEELSDAQAANAIAAVGIIILIGLVIIAIAIASK